MNSNLELEIKEYNIVFKRNDYHSDRVFLKAFVMYCKSVRPTYKYRGYRQVSKLLNKQEVEFVYSGLTIIRKDLIWVH